MSTTSIKTLLTSSFILLLGGLFFVLTPLWAAIPGSLTLPLALLWVDVERYGKDALTHNCSHASMLAHAVKEIYWLARLTAIFKENSLPTRLRVCTEKNRLRFTLKYGLTCDKEKLMADVGRVISSAISPHSVSVRACTHARKVEGEIYHTDPLEVSPSPVLSPIGAVMLGVHADGTATTLDARGTTVLVGGSPGAGKSTVLWGLILAGIADRRTTVHIVDLKPHALEYARARERACVHDSLQACMQALEEAKQFIDEQGEILAARGQRKIAENSPLFLLVIDEIAELSRLARSRDKAVKAEATACLTLLESVTALGRAVGVSVVLSTQKPTTDSVPSAIRDLCGVRVCLRTGTPEQTKAILGTTEGLPAPPWEIAVNTPGRGVIAGEDGKMREFQACHWGDGAIDCALRQR